MASLRDIKKDIDYVVNELVFDCYMSLFYHSDKQEAVVDIMQEAADLRNNLFEMVSNPPEKHNKSLIKKHYRYVREQLFEKTDALFEKLSYVCKA